MSVIVATFEILCLSSKTSKIQPFGSSFLTCRTLNFNFQNAEKNQIIFYKNFCYPTNIYALDLKKKKPATTTTCNLLFFEQPSCFLIILSYSSLKYFLPQTKIPILVHVT